jgi:hypothetical protein
MAKKIYRTEVQDYTGKPRTNYSYSDVVQVNVPKGRRFAFELGRKLASLSSLPKIIDMKNPDKNDPRIHR